MFKVGIIGVSGYAGEKLLDILLRHPEVKITYLAAKMDKKLNIGELFPYLKGKLDLECDNVVDRDKAIQLCDLLFLALPHTVSMQFVPYFLKSGRKVIDLSADYRLKNIDIYEQFYKVQHPDKNNVKKAIYGLPELYRAKIKSAQLIANPGCYPTAAILALAPLLKKNLIKPGSIIIDAKSGFSGAGRETVEKQSQEILNNFKAYKVDIHQHAPEIDQELSCIYGKKIKVTFVPHVLPLEVGILETIYVGTSRQSPVASRQLLDVYKKCYAKEPFVRILEEGQFPQLKDVVGTNYCDIGIKEGAGTVIIIAAIDNLLKGASGQAVQNMNIMYGFSEQMALL
jgi:N-acetyl-gamma-glutamyl-phosphate reductase